MSADGVYLVDDANAPATGDLRIAGPGDQIYVRRAATSRRDWPRIWDALGVAWCRGADVYLMREENS